MRKTEDMWHFIKTVVAPGLISVKTKINLPDDFYLMGTARLRQIRRKVNVSDSFIQLGIVFNSFFKNSMSSKAVIWILLCKFRILVFSHRMHLNSQTFKKVNMW